MKLDEFTSQVMQRLSITDDFDREAVIAGLHTLHTRGFSVTDAVRWCSCLEYVNPDLPEDVALERMATIASRYGWDMR